MSAPGSVVHRYCIEWVTTICVQRGNSSLRALQQRTLPQCLQEFAIPHGSSQRWRMHVLWVEAVTRVTLAGVIAR